MQKNNSIKNLVFRGAVLGLSALFVFVAGLWGLQVFAQSSNGWKFGEILNKILVKNWDDTTNNWTVKNSQQLWWLTADKYLKKNSAKLKCEANQCVTGFNDDWSVICSK